MDNPVFHKALMQLFMVYFVPFKNFLRFSYPATFMALAVFISIPKAKAQCGYAAGLGCSNTNYNNFGYNSYNDPTTIEYDNYVSGYHQTVARTFSGDFKIWGHHIAANGVSHVLSPQDLNATNYPGLTGTILKASIGSYGFSNQQTIILTTTGLFAMGMEGIVLHKNIKNNKPLSKLTIGGNPTGLPSSVAPTDVKMLFVTTGTIAITTCLGDVWVLSQTSEMRGSGSGGNAETWYRVKTNESGVPKYLTEVVAVRGCFRALIALKSDGTIWTWGTHTYLGNGSNGAKLKVATQMTAPKTGSIKMIGATSDENYSSLFILYESGDLFSLGMNAKRQLGDWTTTERKTWVQPRYNSSSGPVMNNIRWISPMEHDRKYPVINVINYDMQLYNWGSEQGHFLGRGNKSQTAVNPGIPLGITPTDQVISVETGGHTTMFTEKCRKNYGYVGHRVYGSMGDGTSDNEYESEITYNTAYVPICGAMGTPQIGVWIINPGGDVCSAANILLDPSPTGGAFSIVSGPGVLHGNELSFTGTGSVTVKYEIMGECGIESDTKTFDVINCNLYKIKGTVWIDMNKNAIRESSEVGTNAGTTLTNGVWANLVDANNIVVQSVPVNLDGRYELYTTVAGTWSVRITNERVLHGNPVGPSFRPLPGDWAYTGNNYLSPCVIPACTDPDIISGLVLNSSTPEITKVDFGIVGALVLPVKLNSIHINKEGDKASLRWMTTYGNDADRFEIMRSDDGINWELIGEVALTTGKGDSETGLLFNFTDHHPLPEANFYRLKVIYRKRFEYSKMVRVHFGDSKIKSRITIYPNPTKDIVKISGLSVQETILIMDNTGRTLIKQNARKAIESIDLSGLSGGIYQILITSPRGEKNIFKVVKRD